MEALADWINSRSYNIFNISKLDGYSMIANNINCLSARLGPDNSDWTIDVSLGKIVLKTPSSTINLLGIHFQGSSKRLLNSLFIDPLDCSHFTIQSVQLLPPTRFIPFTRLHALFLTSFFSLKRRFLIAYIDIRNLTNALFV